MIGFRGVLFDLYGNRYGGRMKGKPGAVSVSIGVWLLAWLVISVSAWGYEDLAVTDGATVSGRVVFDGLVPAPRSYGLIVYPDISLCERISDGNGHRLLRDFTVSENRGFKNVVVAVQEVKRGKPFPFKGPTIGVKDCEFNPFMSVVRDQFPVVVKNEDNILHDIQTYAIRGNKRGDRIFDRPALASSTLTQEIRLKYKQKVVWIQCGKHSFMQAWAYAIDNPYYTITAADGTFTIKDLPPGRYRVTAWHPFMKLREQIIEVAPGSSVKLNFRFGKKD